MTSNQAVVTFTLNETATLVANVQAVEVVEDAFVEEELDVEGADVGATEEETTEDETTEEETTEDETTEDETTEVEAADVVDDALVEVITELEEETIKLDVEVLKVLEIELEEDTTLDDELPATAHISLPVKASVL